MLFYNHKQEFIGIDAEGLKLLNYATLEDLLKVCDDVADLFSKEPGYIHNFKSFGWIDFLLHADSDARSAIVHGNGRTFSCTLQVNDLFLCDDPSASGYIIDMLHIQSLSGDEIKPHSIPPKAKSDSRPPVFETPIPAETAPSVLPNYDHITPTPLSEPGVLDVPSYSEQEVEEEPIEDLFTKLSLQHDDEDLETKYVIPESTFSDKSDIKAEQEVPHQISEAVSFSKAEKEFIDALKVDKSYRFDPNVAAQELGLPVDLIQEFIGDFIQQAHEFKEELFEVVLKGDMNNLKILSHKLKGVAANLRIEDAFETLSNINTSNDPVEIEANLKYFYSIISKLEGKESPAAATDETANDEEFLLPPEKAFDFSEDEPSSPPDDDIYAFDFKNDAFAVPEEERTPASSADEDFDDISFPSEAVLDQEISAESARDDDIYTFDLKDDHEPFVMEEAVQTSSENKEVPTYLLEEKSIEEEPLPIEESNLEESSPAVEPPQTLHFDKISIAGQLGIQLDFFDELIEEYKRDSLRAGSEISAAISAFDTHAWKKTAGQLKGISDNLRLNEISDELAILSQTNDAQEANKASKRLNSFLEQL
ncbi:hypothetical protein Sulku_0325 [Sulfuricurvum kujiense DSM 16994]|uniref:HPt domain-containing protein n=1 Tax=Sulfuricurvum kujiense (strain ATCC BAA-921 / DSM 16994 / JCM 11577 / YK-1) TaxID=709032 RepID=E4TYL5_SULKY|nr:hypothetical protein [Sulfuricurvum kujiense]ADR32992.1 hypothetical protein Sulku_0325 [Sulfuricurvum kujiense DSM 16994]